MSWDSWCDSVGTSVADTWIFDGNDCEIHIWGQKHAPTELPGIEGQDDMLKGLAKPEDKIQQEGVKAGNVKYIFRGYLDDSIHLVGKSDPSTKEDLLVRKCCPYGKSGKDGVFIACRMQKTLHPSEALKPLTDVGKQLKQVLEQGQYATK